MTNTDTMPGSPPEERLVKGWANDRFGPYQFEIRCGTCGQIFYADAATKYQVATDTDAGDDNPFLCDDCEEEDDAQAHER